MILKSRIVLEKRSMWLAKIEIIDKSAPHPQTHFRTTASTESARLGVQKSAGDGKAQREGM